MHAGITASSTAAGKPPEGSNSRASSRRARPRSAPRSGFAAGEPSGTWQVRARRRRFRLDDETDIPFHSDLGTGISSHPRSAYRARELASHGYANGWTDGFRKRTFIAQILDALRSSVRHAALL
jgi:hypothetical protein